VVFPRHCTCHKGYALARMRRDRVFGTGGSDFRGKQSFPSCLPNGPGVQLQGPRRHNPACGPRRPQASQHDGEAELAEHQDVTSAALSDATPS